MKSFNSHALEEAKKSKIKINPKLEDIKEGDYWHPDPEKDKRISGAGNKMRAREDAAERSKPKEDPKKLRPGESYMDYAKRHGKTSVSKPAAKPSLKDRLKNKLGRAIDKIGGINSSYEPEGNEELQEKAPPGAKYERMVKHIKKGYSKGGLTDKEKSIAYATAWKAKNKNQQESAVPGQPAERLGAVTAIPQSERDAAKARILAKTAAKRKEREMAKEEFEIEEGMTLKDYKKKRSALKQKEKRAADKIAPNRRKDIHTDRYSPERAARHRANVDPDFEGNDERNYPGGKLKNPKKIRKAKALGELGETMSFSQFVESRRMDREGVDRGDNKRAERAAKAKASLDAVKKGEERKVKVSKKYNIPVSKADTVEKKAHKQNHPGSRQEPKVRGAKETPSETQNRRANRHNQRVIKHGFTSKEKRDNAAMAKHTSRFD